MKISKYVAGLLWTTLILYGLSAYADTKHKVDRSVIADMVKASKAECFYQIQPATSEVRFSIDSIAGTAKGEFVHFKGGFTLEPDAGNNGQAVFVIKSNSVATSSAIVGELIRGKSFIDIKRYPEISFVSSSFSWLSKTNGLLKGKLTLHGVTKTVAFNVNLSEVGGSDTVFVKIDTSISRSMFGMKLMSKVVSDTVKLSMHIQAKKLNNISEEQLVAMSTYSGF